MTVIDAKGLKVNVMSILSIIITSLIQNMSVVNALILPRVYDCLSILSF